MNSRPANATEKIAPSYSRGDVVLWKPSHPSEGPQRYAEFIRHMEPGRVCIRIPPQYKNDDGMRFIYIERIELKRKL